MKHRETELEARLRADARAMRGELPADLSGRITDRIGAGLREGPAALSAAPVWRRWAPVVAVAAAVLLVVSPWLARDEEPAAHAPDPDVASIQTLLELEPTSLLAGVNDPLAAEAEHLWSDASRAAADFVQALPAPLRDRFGVR